MVKYSYIYSWHGSRFVGLRGAKTCAGTPAAVEIQIPPKSHPCRMTGRRFRAAIALHGR